MNSFLATKRKPQALLRVKCTIFVLSLCWNYWWLLNNILSQIYNHDAELMSIMTLSLAFHPLSLASRYTLPKRSGNSVIRLIFTASALLWRERHTNTIIVQEWLFKKIITYKSMILLPFWLLIIIDQVLLYLSSTLHR